MKYSINDKVVQVLNLAKQHNGNIMVKPEVILWPDPEEQWTSIIPELQKTFPALLIYGSFEPSKKQGPAIWLKCMISQTLPEASWDAQETPIIYLPGISRNDLKNIHNTGLDFQPLIEYQYTGTTFIQENGREWTILAVLQNPHTGLGLRVSQDSATKDALKKALPSIFKDPDVLYGKAIIDESYLNGQLFPDIISNILKWMCKGDIGLSSMDQSKMEIFNALCKSQYDFEPDHRNIKAIAEKLGSQRNSWKYVWQHYANAPHKYPEIKELLHISKPNDLGSGMFAFPEESWPQVNEGREDELRKSLIAVSKLLPRETVDKLNSLEVQHGLRRSWVWGELGCAPLANAIYHLKQMATEAARPFPSSSVSELETYYTKHGYLIDQTMRKSLAVVKSEKDKDTVKKIITTIYKPWLESLTQKFQTIIEKDASIFTTQAALPETETFVLFVDAFRFELAEEFCGLLRKSKFNVHLHTGWSAIPSLTPTAKPNISPIAIAVSTNSAINDFRPQLKSGKDLQTPAFRESLSAHSYILTTNAGAIESGQRYWQEIGDIDTKGHEEQSEIVRRIDELFEQILEVIETAFEKGITRIKIVTDHGWLLLPGGLPKTELSKDLTETRWGRCALIKEAAKAELLHLPWRWNPSLFIAYAPGISFFKRNEEYAHGGISIQECLIPTIIVETTVTSKLNAKIKEVKWVNLKCIVTTEDASDRYTIDIRTKYSDPKSSIVLSANRALVENRISLLVDDEAESKAVTIVLIDEIERILDKTLTTVGG